MIGMKISVVSDNPSEAKTAVGTSWICKSYGWGDDCACTRLIRPCPRALISCVVSRGFGERGDWRQEQNTSTGECSTAGSCRNSEHVVGGEGRGGAAPVLPHRAPRRGLADGRQGRSVPGGAAAACAPPPPPPPPAAGRTAVASSAPAPQRVPTRPAGLQTRLLRKLVGTLHADGGDAGDSMQVSMLSYVHLRQWMHHVPRCKLRTATVPRAYGPAMSELHSQSISGTGNSTCASSQ